MCAFWGVRMEAGNAASVKAGQELEVWFTVCKIAWGFQRQERSQIQSFSATVEASKL